MTKAQRAEIARKNGAKSNGPKTEEGKAKSARNAIQSGEHAQKLSLFVPPHAALLANEDRQAYYDLMDQLLEIYQPINQLAASIVQKIAVAHWQVERLNACITMHWNLALVDAANKPNPLAPELCEVHSMVRSSGDLYSGHALLHRFNREIAQLDLRIARLERRLEFVHANGRTAAAAAYEQTNDEPT